MVLVPSDWKHLLRTETSQKSLLKAFFYDNKGIRKANVSQKFSNEEMHFTLQSNSSKYNKAFKFTSWSNFLEGHHFLSLDIWVKLLVIV